MTKIIAVGYTTRSRADVAQVPSPVFTAPGNYGAEAAAKYVATQTEKFLADCGETPHYGELATLAMVDPTHQRVFEPLKPKKGKAQEVVAPLEVQAGDWILDKWRSAFPSGLQEQPHPPEVIFVGFGMRTFLKLLGLRCVEEGKPLPPSLWYANSEHRDIGRAICGDDSWQTLQASLYRLLYADRYKDYRPGQDASLDVTLTMDLLSQLGMLS